MILISHRGNLKGKNPSRENSPDYIGDALVAGYNVEIDVWYEGGIWHLGHDEPQYQVNMSFLMNRMLWCHAKNIAALSRMRSLHPHVRYFWHQEDDVTLTSDRYLWTYPGKKLYPGSICVMPESTGITVDSPDLKSGNVLGVCSDYISRFDSLA